MKKYVFTVLVLLLFVSTTSSSLAFPIGMISNSDELIEKNVLNPDNKLFLFCYVWGTYYTADFGEHSGLTIDAKDMTIYANFRFWKVGDKYEGSDLIYFINGFYYKHGNRIFLMAYILEAEDPVPWIETILG